MKKIIIKLSAILLFSAFIGCVSSPPVPIIPKEPVVKTLRFSRNIQSMPPHKKPSTVEEHIKCGLFYFDQEKYKKAASEFTNGSKKIINKNNSLYRSCLLSASVCHLLNDDKNSFVKTFEAVQTSYSEYEWLVAKDDVQLKSLLRLYDELIKGM